MEQNSVCTQQKVDLFLVGLQEKLKVFLLLLLLFSLGKKKKISRKDGGIFPGHLCSPKPSP